MNGVSATHLLGLPVRVRGIELGRPVDLVLDREHTRALGFEVLCGDEERRFLPLAVATVSENALQVRSPFGLLNNGELAFYTKRGSTFASLRGSEVLQGRTSLGVLEDLAIAPEGTIASVVVATRDGREELEYRPGMTLGAAGSRVRAAS